MNIVMVFPHPHMFNCIYIYICHIFTNSTHMCWYFQQIRKFHSLIPHTMTQDFITYISAMQLADSAHKNYQFACIHQLSHLFQCINSLSYAIRLLFWVIFRFCTTYWLAPFLFYGWPKSDHTFRHAKKQIRNFLEDNLRIFSSQSFCLLDVTYGAWICVFVSFALFWCKRMTNCKWIWYCI